MNQNVTWYSVHKLVYITYYKHLYSSMADMIHYILMFWGDIVPMSHPYQTGVLSPSMQSYYFRMSACDLLLVNV